MRVRGPWGTDLIALGAVAIQIPLPTRIVNQGTSEGNKISRSHSGRSPSRLRLPLIGTLPSFAATADDAVVPRAVTRSAAGRASALELKLIS
jgi:hypothetical protein